MMAFALLFAGTAFADPLPLTAQLGTGYEDNATGETRMGIYQTVAVTFPAQMLASPGGYVGVNKIVTLKYTAADGKRTHDDKVEKIFKADDTASSPVGGVDIIMDNLVPDWDYTYEVEVRVQATNELIAEYRNGTFHSFAGILADLPDDLFVVEMSEQVVRLVIDATKVKSISGENLTATKFVPSVKKGDTALTLSDAVVSEDGKTITYTVTNAAGLTQCDKLTASVEVQYKGQQEPDTKLQTKSVTKNFEFGINKINPLWIYVVKEGNDVGSCAIVVKNMPNITTGTAMATLWVTTDGTNYTKIGTKSLYEGAEEGEQFRFKASEIKVKADFDFKMEITLTNNLSVLSWKIGNFEDLDDKDDCHALKQNYAYKFDFGSTKVLSTIPGLKTDAMKPSEAEAVKAKIAQFVLDGVYTREQENDLTKGYYNVKKDDVLGFECYVPADAAQDDWANQGDETGLWKLSEGTVQVLSISEDGVAEVKITAATITAYDSDGDPDQVGQSFFVKVPAYSATTPMGLLDVYAAADATEAIGWKIKITSTVAVAYEQKDIDEDAIYTLAVNGGDPLESDPQVVYNQFGFISVPTDAATVEWYFGANADAGTKFDYDAKVTWPDYLIYEKGVNKNFYPEILDQATIYSYTGDDVQFEDWAKTPANTFKINGVYVLYDGDAAKNVVKLTLPKVYNDGKKIGKINVTVFIGPRTPTFPFNPFADNSTWQQVASTSEDVTDIVNDVKTFGQDIALDEAAVAAIVKKSHVSLDAYPDGYYDVRVVITGDDYEYDLAKEDHFSKFNTDGTLEIAEITQPVSADMKRLNVEPVLELNDFVGSYKINGTLVEVDKDGNVVTDGDSKKAPELERVNGKPDAESVLEHGLVFTNVKPDTWYKLTVTFTYEAERDPLWSDGATEKMFIAGTVIPVDTVFQTSKLPTASNIMTYAPKYYIDEEVGHIHATLRFTTQNAADQLFVEVNGKEYEVTKTATFEEPTPFGPVSATYRVVDVPFVVDLDPLTVNIPASWNLGYTAYVKSEGVVVADVAVDKTGYTAIRTPLPYVQFVNPSALYEVYPLLLTYEFMYGAAPARRAGGGAWHGDGNEEDPSTGTDSPFTPEEELALKKAMYPILSAWEAAAWAKANLHNTFAYTNIDVTPAPGRIGFENAMDPKYFGAANLVFKADIEDYPFFMSERPGRVEVLSGNEILHQGAQARRAPNHVAHKVDLMKLVGDHFEKQASIQGYGIYYNIKQRPGQQVDPSEIENLGDYAVAVLPADQTSVKYAEVMNQLVTLEYQDALDDLYPYMNFGFDMNNPFGVAYAFSVLLTDADGEAPAEDNYPYINLFPFRATKAVYKAVFPARDRTVVIPFEGAASLDEEGTQPAVVRYFSAGYLDEDNKAVFKFSKKLRNNVPTNVLTAGVSYLVDSGDDSMNFGDVFFTGENVTLVPSLPYAEYDVEYLAWVGDENDAIIPSWSGLQIDGDLAFAASLIGTYQVVFDAEYWSAFDAQLWNSLPESVVEMLEANNPWMSFWPGLADFQEGYNEFKQTAIYRYSSVASKFRKMNSKAKLEYDKETGKFVDDGTHTYVKPFQSAMIFYGGNNPNAGLSIEIRFDDDDATMIENNVIVETSNADLFDLMGRKVNEPVKGQIYIQNGKKILF